MILMSLDISCMTIKSAGVKEYWVMDPDKLKIIVYNMEENFGATIYGFENEVSVGIYDGKCKVNFKDILEDVSFLL